MSPFEYLEKRLREEMYEGNMHACLRDVGRLAGGYNASGSLSLHDVHELGSIAETLALNKAEATTKWGDAVAFGGGEPVAWDASQHSAKPDRALDWDDAINDDYKLSDVEWTESIEIEEPSAWDPISQVSEYISTLFGSEEFVGYVTESWVKDGKHIPSRGSFSRTAGELLSELSRYRDLGSVFGDVDPEVGAWIRFNPLDGQGVRDSNVTDFRFALVESDQLPIEEQRGLYEKLELPIAALVHSGNKSLHAIVRIDAPDFDVYRKRVDLLYQVCEKNGLTIDRQNRNPSRLSRMPGVDRAGMKQFLVATNIGRKSWSEWEDWIEAVNDDLPNPESLSVEWDRLPPLSPPLIEGVLRQGHKMLVSGPSKAGKSFLLIQLCAAIAEGKQWLGWQCSKGRVLYVNLELDRASCLHRFRDVYMALGWDPLSIESIDIWNLRGQAVPMDRLAPKLIRRSLRKQYSAVVIDPIYKVITGDENAADKMAHFCNQFDRVCHELRAAVIYCHHHSKGSQGGKRSMDRASGSGVFARDPDALLDLIELVVSDELRKERENRAICDLVARTLDRDHPGWRGSVSDDDMLSESEMTSIASRTMGERFARALRPLMPPERARVASMSAWRVEGTFREYPRTPPVNLWFDYPRHRLDGVDGTLKDTCPHADEPPWARGSKAYGSKSGRRKNDRGSKLREAFDTVGNGQSAKIADVANYMDKAVRTVRDWVSQLPGWGLNDGILTLKQDNESESF